MVKGIYTAARGLEYRGKNIDAVANNLANLNSTGFKREGEFQQILNSLGETETRQVRDLSQGNLVNTTQPLDVAIRGEGFFEVKTENGTQLTRNGRFTISEEGFLITSSGDKVMGSRGEINLSSYRLNDDQSIEITRNGEIKVGKEIVDTLKISTVDDPQKLSKAGGSNFMDDHQEYIPANEDKFEIMSGYIEESNVNPIFEMQKMIQINKEYEAAQKVINTIDSSLASLREIGKAY
jgi:flagellar basal-body rod protein FlgF